MHKTHYFCDNHDNRVVVHTCTLPDGAYEAETNGEHGQVFGYGSTRLEAIADLQEQIDLERDQ